jgi:hypothetical protein
MMSSLSFNKHYAILFLLLLSIETGIALWINDSIIRPYLGDMLVVILLYVFIKSILPLSTYPLAISIFFFACLVEVAQFFGVVSLIGLQHNDFARIVMGTQFDWKDVLAYALGITIVIICEKIKGGCSCEETQNLH